MKDTARHRMDCQWEAFVTFTQAEVPKTDDPLSIVFVSSEVRQTTTAAYMCLLYP